MLRLRADLLNGADTGEMFQAGIFPLQDKGPTNA